MKKKKICMVVQNAMVKGGIAAVVNGYRDSKLEQDYKMIYVESYKDGGKFTKLLKGICGYIHFAKVLLFDKPDVVHIHSSFGASFYRKIPFILMTSWARKPLINHIHGADFDEFYARASHAKKIRIKRIYEKCSVLIALSDEWKSRLAQIVSESKIRIVENYSILHEDAMKERASRGSNNTVLFLGQLGHRKGCYDIPAVAEKVVLKVPNVQFIMGGSGSLEDETAIKKLFNEKGLHDHVVFPGWVRGEEKDKLLREADVFFLPSYNEGMPMSVLDAMGYGLPIVSTNVGGIPKIVHNNENGICCDAGNIDAYSKALISILNDSEKCKQYGNESGQIVRNKYSLDAHLQVLEEIYAEVCQ